MVRVEHGTREGRKLAQVQLSRRGEGVSGALEDEVGGGRVRRRRQHMLRYLRYEIGEHSRVLHHISYAWSPARVEKHWRDEVRILLRPELGRRCLEAVRLSAHAKGLRVGAYAKG